MQQTTNQLAQDQNPANAEAQQAPSLEAKYKEAQRLVSMAADLDGAEDRSEEQAANFARLLETRPELRSEILAILHEKFGNSFVQIVTHPSARVAKGANKGGAAGAVNAVPAPPAPTGGKSNAVVDAVKMDMLQTTHAEGGAAGAANAVAPTAESSKGPAAPAPEAAKPQMDAAAQAAPPAPAPVESKKEPAAEPAPPPKQEVGSASQTPVAPPPAPAQQETKKEPAAQAPVPDAAPPGKQDVASATQTPAPPAPESAPKTEEKSAIEKGQEEKPQDKADGEVKITASALRVRAEANFNGKIIGKIPRGGKAKVKGQQGVWLEIEWHNGGVGFIHSKYTTAVKGNEGAEEEEHQGEESAHEQKQERPKAPPVPTNDDQQKAVV